MEACASKEVSKEPVPAVKIAAETFAACRQGDRIAFRCLFEAYKDRVFSIAVYFLQGDAATAEDITQEVFVRVYTHLNRFRCEAEFSTWLYRLVSNACIDEYRRRKRQPVVAGWDETRQNPQNSSVDAYRRIEITDAIRVALDELTPEMRLTVLLRFFEDMTYDEIAEILQCSQGTVASRLNRALKQLAKRLVYLQNEK